MMNTLQKSLLVLFPLLLGCGGASDGQPAHLRYGSRSERIVVRTPNVEVDALEPAGELDALLAQIDAKGGETFDPTTLSEEVRKQVETTLEPLFGTPARPKVNDSRAASFGLTPENLTRGSYLFARHCQQCHGIPGDGRGPTGPWIQPHPRDFRSGKFKFITTRASGILKPQRDDLRRTLLEGLKGSAMPNFQSLSEQDRERLIDYVVHLSLRGQVERQLLLELREDELTAAAMRSLAEQWLTKFLQEWLQAESNPLLIPEWANGELEEPDPEAVRRGYEIFSSDQTGACAKCHIDFGRKSKYRFDDWGTLVRPNDLTSGVYRGGSRPADLFARLNCGIAPSGMPAANQLKPNEQRDLVQFLLALPYPAKLPPGVREKLMPKPE
jgi:mono/diheme cytochrome c family protein